MGEATWAPAPTVPTIAETQKIVAGYVLMPRRTEALETALYAIREAIDKLNTMREWNWSLVSEDLPLDAALVDYPVPSNFKKAARLLVVDANDLSVFRIPYYPWVDFLDKYAKQHTSGDPCAYSCANAKEFGTVSLDVIPSVSFVSQYPTLRLWYYRAVQYEAENGAADWPSYATPLIVAWAKKVMAETYAPGKVLTAAANYREARQDLETYDNEIMPDWGD